jgi:hypothetical protein
VNARSGAPQAAGDPDRRVAGGGPDVILIGYQDQGNLGMGYLAAMLERQGRTVEMVEVREGARRIAARLTGTQPLVVGFSLSFQFFYAVQAGGLRAS